MIKQIKIYVSVLVMLFALPIKLNAQNTVYQMLYNDVTFTKSISTGLPVGVIDGQQGTTQTGAATYNIPIKVTPGINGMEPKLAITYSSQSGNGLLGVGWNLSGLSAITLDNRNIYFNGKTAPVNIAPSTAANETAFLLDGIRLISTNGTYGAVGTTYAKEVEDYSIITSLGSANPTCGCPSSFEIKTKDGLKMEYGNNGSNPDALTLSSGNQYPITWRLRRTTDINGNYIDYKYSVTTDGESKIDEINYTGNNLTGSAPFAKIKFIYLDRLDQNTTYVVGTTSTNATSLKTKSLLYKIIITTDAGPAVKTYQLNYAFEGLYSVLQEVKEIGSDNTEFNSTIFRYGDAGTPQSTITNNISSSNADLFPGDFDGDGYSDILQAVYNAGTPVGKIYKTLNIFRKIPNTTNFQLAYTKIITPWTSTATSFPKISIGDFNGDGKSDILLDNYSYNTLGGSTLSVEYKSSNVFTMLYSFGTTTIFFNEVNYTSTIHNPFIAPIYYQGSSMFTEVKNRFITGDFNGDGKTDVINTMLSLINNSFTARSFISQPDNNSLFVTLDNSGGNNDYGLTNNLVDNKVLSVADFDGDGKQEILISGFSTNNASIFKINENNVINTVITPITSSYLTDANIFTGDFNGDGKTDILKGSGTLSSTWYVEYSTGSSFVEKQFNLGTLYFGKDNNYNAPKLVCADFNGDGKADIFQSSYDDVNKKSTYFILYSNGTDFKLQTGEFSNTDKYIPQTLGDFNGDGGFDILNTSWNTNVYPAATKPCLINYIGNQQNKKQLLTKVIDGFNRKTEFTYKLLTVGDYTFYDAGDGPQQLPSSFISGIKIPLYAVSSLNLPNGIGGNTLLTYSYSMAKYQRTGKGFLGFSSILCKNSSTNILTQTTYSNISDPVNQIFSNSMPDNIKKFVFGGATISEQNITRTIGNLGNKRYKIDISNFIDRDDVNGSYETTVNTFDANGNITKSILNKSGIETTTTDYQNIDNNYYTVPFQFKDIVVTTVRGSKTYINKTNYSYDNKGRIFNKIENYQSATKPKNIAYTYDSYGNISTTTYSGNTSAGGTINYTKSDYYLDGKGRYLNMVINPYVTNNISYSSFDNRWSKPGYSGNYNGMISAQYAYDAFGRLIKTSPISPSYTIPYTIDTKYDWSTQYGSTYKVTTSATGVQVFQPETKYYDAFDRLVRQEKTENGKLKFTTNYYDAKGDIIKIETNDANGGTITINNTYDNYHRLINSTNVTTGVNTSNIYTASYSAGVTTSTAITAQPSKITKTDGTGKITEVTETGGTTSVKNTYTYHANGNILKVFQGGNDLVTYDYDENANQIQLKDVDAGITNYEYDAFGNITKQTDANGNEMNMKYNTYNQLYNKTIKDNNYPSLLNNVNYYYNAPYTNGENRISKVEYTNNVDVGENILDEFAYDIVDRLKQQDRKFEGKKFSTIYDYDDYRLIALTQPKATTTGIPLKVNYTTTSDGFVTKVNTNAGISTDVFTAINTDYNANDQITKYNYPNGMTSEIYYDFLGLPDYIKSTKTSVNSVLHSLLYSWNTQNGNLNSKNDYWSGKGESYQYDEFNRLKIITPNGSTSTLDIGFDGNGNILKKYDAGIKYEYKTDKIHAVEKIKAGMGYTNPVKPDDRTDISTVTQDIKTNPSNATSTYNAFNQPSLITEGTNELKYIYDYNGQRIKSIYKENGTLKTTRYYFGNYEFETNGGAITTDASTTRQLYYINAPDGLASIFVRENSTDKYYYIHNDYLGSIEMVTDATANIVTKQNFDAWGRQRDPISWSYTISALPPPAWLYRGYTGHEMLSKFSLINMNGRLYDPIVGRMLSPDNIIHDIYNTQHYNRYSYVWNNPLKYIDIDGEDPVPPTVPVYTSQDLYNQSQFYGNNSQYMGPGNGSATVELSSVGNGVGITMGSLQGNSVGFYINYVGTLSGSFINTIGTFANTYAVLSTPNITNGLSGGNGCILQYMNNATAGIPAQYLSVGNGKGGAPTWVDKAENKINNFFSKYDKIAFPALMIPEKVLYSAKTLSTYNSISKIQLPFNFLGLNVNPTTFYHSVSATNAIGNFGSYLSIGFSVKRLYKGQGSIGWNIMDGVVSFAATKHIYGAIFSTAYPGYKSIIQDIQNGNDLYENEVIKAFFIFPYPQKK